jgi:hypothetical protein
VSNAGLSEAILATLLHLHNIFSGGDEALEIQETHSIKHASGLCDMCSQCTRSRLTGLETSSKRQELEPSTAQSQGNAYNEAVEIVVDRRFTVCG